MNRVLLLTSTVNPSIQSAGTPQKRLEEYLHAIHFYLNNTNYNIVIVDNSGYDYNNDINNKRFESFSYIAPREDSVYGKGYGEAKIMLYAFNHSFFLNNAVQVIKVTGRHIISNIGNLLSHCALRDVVYADSDINTCYAHSYMIVAPSKFYVSYLLNRYLEMNDANGSHFEHVLAKSIIQWEIDGNIRKQFYLPVYIKGHPGASNVEYAKPNILRYFLIWVKYYLYNLKHKLANI